MTEKSNLIELFPAPEPVSYEEAQRHGLGKEEQNALLMRGFIEPATSDTPMEALDQDRSRRIEGAAIITSLRAIEKRAMEELKKK